MTEKNLEKENLPVNIELYNNNILFNNIYNKVTLFNIKELTEQFPYFQELSKHISAEELWKILNCKNVYAKLQCKSCYEHTDILIPCRSLFCPSCMKDRKNRHFLRYGEFISRLKNPKVLVLNFENIKFISRNKIVNFKSAVKKFYKKFKFKGFYQIHWNYHEIGSDRYSRYGKYLGKYDETNYGHNLHCHMIYEGDFIPYKEMLSAWKKALKSKQLKGQTVYVQNIKKMYSKYLTKFKYKGKKPLSFNYYAAQYVINYINKQFVKGTKLNDEFSVGRYVQFIEALRQPIITKTGKERISTLKLINPFGYVSQERSYFKVEKVGLRCGNCNSSWWKLQEQDYLNPFIILDNFESILQLKEDFWEGLLSYDDVIEKFKYTKERLLEMLEQGLIYEPKAGYLGVLK